MLGLFSHCFRGEGEGYAGEKGWNVRLEWLVLLRLFFLFFPCGTIMEQDGVQGGWDEEYA